MEVKKKISLMVILILIMQVLLPTLSLITSKVIAADNDMVTLTFKDENLFNALKEALGDKISSSSGPSTEGNYVISMTKENLELVNRLELSDKQIGNIEGIEGFVELEQLDLSENKITNINSLSGLTKLIELELDKNQITTIDSLSSLKDLEYLYLRYNKITNIDSLSGLSNLYWLELDNNEITSISGLSNLSNIYCLYLSSNKITNIDVLSNLTNLNLLDLSNNEITNIDSLSSLSHLSELCLDNNKIKNVNSLSNLSELEWLYLDNNFIENMASLENLNLLGLFIGNQTIVKYVDNNSTSIELPQIFKASQQEGSKVYSSEGIMTNNCQVATNTLSYESSNVGHIFTSIKEGNAKGTVLYITESEDKANEIINGTFKVYNKDDLVFVQAISNVIPNDFSDKTVELQNNIDLGNEEWTPIGSIGTPFNGTFKGNGFKITGLKIDSEEDFQGFFGSEGEEGIIENLTVEGSVKSTGNYIAGICGLSYGTIQNCHNAAKIEGKEFVGGITGSGTYTFCCYNTGAIQGYIYVGGICGESFIFAYNKISNCYNVGTVEGETNLGAIAGAIRPTKTIATDNYYLSTSGLTAFGWMDDDEENNIRGISEEEMKSPEFVTALNRGRETESWKKGEGIYCYPILVFESNKEGLVVTSEQYIIDLENNYIKNINPQTTAQDLKEALTTNATEVKLFKGEQELGNSDKVGTNTKVYLKNEDDEKTLTLIVIGDVDGNGDADFWDMLAINKHRLEIEMLNEIQTLAGDVTKDHHTDFWDMVEINNFRLGLKETL